MALMSALSQYLSERPYRSIFPRYSSYPESLGSFPIHLITVKHVLSLTHLSQLRATQQFAVKPILRYISFISTDCYPFLALLTETRIRVSEGLQLLATDLDRCSGTVSVMRRHGGKVAIQLSPHLMSLLLCKVQTALFNDGYLFAEPCETATFLKMHYRPSTSESHEVSSCSSPASARS
jgi:hypothetical protein